MNDAINPNDQNQTGRVDQNQTVAKESQLPHPALKPKAKFKQPVSYDVFRNDPRLKSPFFAAFLSLVPGVGQIYVGYYVRGFVNAIVVGIIISILTFSGNSPNVPFYFPLPVLFIIFFWLYNIIDAWRRAVMYNLSLQGVENIPMPDEFQGPGLAGSLFGGLLLLGVGFMILMHTRFDMPLEVLEEWWPVVPMAFGGFLIYRHYEDQKKVQ